ncbi:uncharacterized protein LOC119397197 [Rhipicephalus sanguineus]|uniref:uncharacterized protein LOC119397197 n=1 Tax=Rhipicephalus sanguineus TaxID=34632 RepID=UPI0018958071|nr:uncharacterized protein LOC119397197 [Rhipicephalus sanguineus]
MNANIRDWVPSYHPQTNGLVERFHRHLKAALTAHSCPDKWVDRLPLTLLGIRSSFKEDLSCSTSELVYGTSLRLPADFFEESGSANKLTATEYVDQLREVFRHIRPQPTRSQPRAAYIAQDLQTATHVFVRYGPVRAPLQPHYLGPFRVLERRPANFVVDMNGTRDTIALERLKPAFSEAPALNYLAVPPSAGHNGSSSPSCLSSPPLRRVHWDDDRTENRSSHQLPL